MSDTRSQSLQPIIDAAQELIDNLGVEYRGAVARIAQLERALAFYCDGDGYIGVAGRQAAVSRDGGVRARKALPEWEARYWE